MQKSCCRHSTENHEPNQIYHVTATDLKKIGRRFPTDPFLGVHPLQRSSQDSAHYNPTTSVLWVCTPSILLFSDRSALRHTKSLRTPCSRTLPLSLCSHVLLLFGVCSLLPAFPRSVSGFRTLVDTVVFVTP